MAKERKYNPEFCYFKDIVLRTGRVQLSLLEECLKCEGLPKEECKCYLPNKLFEAFAKQDIVDRKKQYEKEDKDNGQNYK